MIPAAVLDRTVADVFETMYFRQAERCGAGPIAAHAIGARVCFSGDLTGEFRIAVSDDLANRLTADFLAEDSCPADTGATIRELANVLCGAAMGAWRPECDLTFAIPSPLDAEAAASTFGDRFAIEGDEAALAIRLDLGHQPGH